MRQKITLVVESSVATDINEFRNAIEQHLCMQVKSITVGKPKDMSPTDIDAPEEVGI